MKFYTFEHSHERRIGFECAGRLVDWRVAACDSVFAGCAPAPADMMAFLRGGDAALASARRLHGRIANHRDAFQKSAWAHRFEDVTLRAPIAQPGKILCSGVNYRGHLEENPNATLPSDPFFFAKMPSAVIGPREPIVHPKRTRQLDYEIELAVVIGRRLSAASPEEAMAGVAGYTVLHDVSARDIQFKDSQITLGKNFDTFCPMGPCLVTPDEITAPNQLGLRTYLNGRLMQNGSTSDWVFPLPDLLSFLSAVMTLEPGDVVSTGTPAGVGLFQKPQVFLQPGDLVRLEIDGIGTLENPVIAA